MVSSGAGVLTSTNNINSRLTANTIGGDKIIDASLLGGKF